MKHPVKQKLDVVPISHMVFELRGSISDLDHKKNNIKVSSPVLLVILNVIIILISFVP